MTQKTTLRFEYTEIRDNLYKWELLLEDSFREWSQRNMNMGYLLLLSRQLISPAKGVGIYHDVLRTVIWLDFESERDVTVFSLGWEAPETVGPTDYLREKCVLINNDFNLKAYFDYYAIGPYTKHLLDRDAVHYATI